LAEGYICTGIRFRIRLRFLAYFRLRCDGSKNLGSGFLNGFQTLAQEIGVSMPKLDVVCLGLNRFAV